MFIVTKDNKIILADTEKKRLINTLAFMPEHDGAEVQEVTDDELEQGYDGGWYYKGEAPEKPGDVRKAEILARLEAIDSESARPIRAVALGTATDYDKEKIQALEAEAVALREELAGL